MGKQIEFTRHAKQRSFERNTGHYIKLAAQFKEAKKISSGFWADIYEDQEGIIYVVNEKEHAFIVITVWRKNTYG